MHYGRGRDRQAVVIDCCPMSSHGALRRYPYFFRKVHRYLKAIDGLEYIISDAIATVHAFANLHAVVMIAIQVVASFLASFVLFYSDLYDDPVLTCLRRPAASTMKFNRLLYSFTAVGLLAVTANICLFIINRRKQDTLRFNVTHRFEAYENVLLTKWIGLVAIAQFVFMTTDSLAIFLIRTRSRNLPDVTREVLINWFYTLSTSRDTGSVSAGAVLYSFIATDIASGHPSHFEETHGMQQSDDK
ncbi:unnamed protein product [Angiostrongylus costaricensis]|uniref:G protein-coupled receptor n=1 Tax=Angiostrongylus costaricensis TaxID=334426 RepID=A0A158PLY6_ANGCS|nr:unnamed protein product [Angiostrongylus costaricensis]